MILASPLAARTHDKRNEPLNRLDTVEFVYRLQSLAYYNAQNPDAEALFMYYKGRIDSLDQVLGYLLFHDESGAQ